MTAQIASIGLIGCMMTSAAATAAITSPHLMRRMQKVEMHEGHEIADGLKAGAASIHLDATGASPHHPTHKTQRGRKIADSTNPRLSTKHGSTGTHHAQLAEAAGQAPSVWMTFLNKHVNPACADHEFKHDLGVKHSREECLRAVKASKFGNVGLWHRGLDKSCHVCDLHARGKAPSLSYIESAHTDAFVQFSGHTHFYSNNGQAFMLTPGEWVVKCTTLPTTTKYITVTYGAKTDFFKPVEGTSQTNSQAFCSMLQANNEHLWSPDGADDSWEQPVYFSTSSNGHDIKCGGSDENWPSTQNSADSREFLPTWCTQLTGQTDNRGGFGSESGPASWNRAFDIHYLVEYQACDVTDGLQLSSTYPCECGNTHCSAGQACTSSISQCAAPPVNTVNTGNTTDDANATAIDDQADRANSIIHASTTPIAASATTAKPPAIPLFKGNGTESSAPAATCLLSAISSAFAMWLVLS